MTTHLRPEEVAALRYAQTAALTPPEVRELKYFLDVHTLPPGTTARVLAVAERIAALRSGREAPQ